MATSGPTEAAAGRTDAAARTTAYDAIVVGAGHNGLTTAAYLARAGLRTLVLERRDHVGGTVETIELAPGVRAPGFAQTVGRLRPSVARDLDLRAHGLSLVAPEVRAFAPQPDGRAVTLWGDVARTAEGLVSWSRRDAAAYPDFDRLVRSLGRFLAELGARTPPDLAHPGVGDALAGLALGRGYRGLGRRDGRTILRVLAMAVADFVAESFESDAVRAALAWRGVRDAALGPWSAGTTLNLLTDGAGNDGGAAGETVFARGGPGALADALAGAARAAGAEIRTGAEVVTIDTDQDGRAIGVTTRDGASISAALVASALDPKRTLNELVDPVVVGPTMRWRVGNLRQPGIVGVVTLALAGLPRFTAAADDARLLRGRILVGATGIDALERAFDASKYGRLGDSLVLEATIPSLVDPSLVAGAPDGTHVMQIHAQWAPYGLRDGGPAAWDVCRDELGDRVVATLETAAPGIGALATARRVLTPLDLERDYGLSGGHPAHVEQALESWFMWRPVFGHAAYRSPVAGLFLCGPGTHPGGGVTAGPGRNAAREILADWRRRRR